MTRIFNVFFLFVSLYLLCCCGSSESDNDVKIRTFLSGVSFSYDSLVLKSVAIVGEMLPEQSCIVYAADIGCSMCIAQIIDDLKSMDKAGSELNVWIVSTKDAETMYIDYYLFDRNKKEEFGLSGLGFSYYVVPDVFLQNVVEGLYLFKEGRMVNFLQN